MRYFALASDYDGTLAHDGRVSDKSVAALERWKASGRRLILVTGRELPELLSVFPMVGLCDRVVAENGALVYTPATKEEKLLADPPSAEFIRQLRERGVSPMSVGRTIVATWSPHETTVVETIRDLGLELQVIFNKGAVMVLPSGVNKATGLAAALRDLDLSPHNCLAVGDAENDHALLAQCECSAAVANALPQLKARADIILTKSRGEGVAELIDRVLQDDLRDVEQQVERHQIIIGQLVDGRDLALLPYRQSVLVTGPSGSGKARLVADVLQLIADKRYQFCVLDPEGDYVDLKTAVVIGDATHPPTETALLEVLRSPTRSVVVNLSAISAAERFAQLRLLLGRLDEMRSRLGRPHWVAIDEAHHALPARTTLAAGPAMQQCGGMLLIADHPESVAHEVLKEIDLVLALGPDSAQTLAGVRAVIGKPALPDRVDAAADNGPAAWFTTEDAFIPFRPLPTKHDRLSHVRKYLHGDVGRENNFVFCGPRNALKLRAQNLLIFLQMAQGVDDESWLFHLQSGDYSRWLRTVIHDPQLADEIAQIEKQADSTAQATRDKVEEAILRRYSLPG